MMHDPIRAEGTMPRMKLISWNTAARSGRAAEQAEAMLARDPDVVALQEVTPTSFPILKSRLSAGGLHHLVSAVPTNRPSDRSRATGVMIACRFALSESPAGVSPRSRPEKAITAMVDSPIGPTELTVVHVPPGSSHGWEKIRVFEQVYKALATTANTHRILCGDFNSPQAELPSGEVVCWGKRLCKDGQWRLRRSRRGGSAEGWERGEHRVMFGLRDFDLCDAFRTVHGLGKPAFSFELRRGATITRRRFDHVFASHGLAPISFDYLHDLRERSLSDHAPIEVVFDPTTG